MLGSGRLFDTRSSILSISGFGRDALLDITLTSDKDFAPRRTGMSWADNCCRRPIIIRFRFSDLNMMWRQQQFIYDAVLCVLRIVMLFYEQFEVICVVLLPHRTKTAHRATVLVHHHHSCIVPYGRLDIVMSHKGVEHNHYWGQEIINCTEWRELNSLHDQGQCHTSLAGMMLKRPSGPSSFDWEAVPVLPMYSQLTPWT